MSLSSYPSEPSQPASSSVQVNKQSFAKILVGSKLCNRLPYTSGRLSHFLFLKYLLKIHLSSAFNPMRCCLLLLLCFISFVSCFQSVYHFTLFSKVLYKQADWLINNSSDQRTSYYFTGLEVKLVPLKLAQNLRVSLPCWCIETTDNSQCCENETRI